MRKSRTLPRWKSSMSDGCSALAIGPRALRRRFNDWLFAPWPAAGEACARHDKAYYYGGTKQQRLEADEALDQAWGIAGVPGATRLAAYAAIRAFGGPGWRTPGVAWSFGGELFEYTDAPAREAGDRVDDSVNN